MPLAGWHFVLVMAVAAGSLATAPTANPTLNPSDTAACDGDDCSGGAATDLTVQTTDAAALADEIPPLELDELDLEEFREHISKGKWFVKFYAPWCKHCQALAPHWREMAIKLHAGPDDVNIARLDCTKAEDVCAAEMVKGYPTLRFYDGDFTKDYRGVRAPAAIETFISRAIEPAVSTVGSLEELRDLQASNPVLFLFFDTDAAVADPATKGRPTSWADEYASAAKQARFIAWMATTSNSTILEALQKNFPSVAVKPTRLVVLKDGDALRYPGGPTSLAMTTWIKKQRYASVVELTHSVAHDVKKEFPELFLAALLLRKRDNNTAVMEDYAKLARHPDHARSFQFTFMYYETWHQYVTKRWQLYDVDVPALVVLNAQTQDYAVLGRGDEAGSVESGLDLALLRDGLRTIVDDTARWHQSENILQWIRNSVFKSTESAVFMVVALQAEHPTLVQLTILTTSMLIALMIKQCCCPNVSGVKSKAD